MLDKDLCEYEQKDPKGALGYYQDKINKVVNEIENSDKKYTIKDFPMKINMSIIGDENILSYVKINENYSLLRKESEVYIYPTKIKNSLEEMIKKKENINIGKKEKLYNKALCSLVLAFISSFIIISGMFASSMGEPVLKGFWGAVICNFVFLWGWGLFLSIFYIFCYSYWELEEQVKDLWFFILVLSPVKAISIIIFIKNAIKYKKEADNYSPEDIELKLNKLLKDLPQSVRNIVLAEKVSFY